MHRRTLIPMLACAGLMLTATPAALAQDGTGTVMTSTGTTAAADQGGGHTAAIALLIAIGVLLIAGAAAWGFARWWAYEPAWLLRVRHATAEAGWRTSAAWAEFRDWVRLGR